MRQAAALGEETAARALREQGLAWSTVYDTLPHVITFGGWMHHVETRLMTNLAAVTARWWRTTRRGRSYPSLPTYRGAFSGGSPPRDSRRLQVPPATA